MTTPKAAVLAGLCVLLASACTLAAPGTREQDLDNACRAFVQGFYDWYVPQALADTAEPAWDLVLKEKGQVFSPELFRQLTADAEAQAAADGDLVGLDFDPFLSCQDCEARYVIGEATRRGNTCSVDVSAMWSGVQRPTVVVLPEVRQQGTQWQFIDFHYPNPSRPEFESLLSQLKYLRELDRQMAHPK